MNITSSLDETAALRLLESLHDGGLFIALYDQDDVIRYANVAFRNAFMCDRPDPIDFATLLRSNHSAGTGASIGAIDIETYIRRALTRRRSRPYCAFQLDLIDGRRLWLTETLLPDDWLLCVATDITVLKQSEAVLRNARDVALKASQTDYLTKLPNRRYGFQFLKRALDNAHVYREPLTVALLDLDHFRRINEQYGHEAGDAALRKFADTCRAELRASDTVARVGGEEFVIIWPHTPMEFALEILQRLHRTPLQVRHDARRLDFSFTFSAGIAQALPEDSLRSLLVRADKSLYAAKANGRHAIDVSAG